MVFSAIKKIIKIIFRALYAVISLLNLQFTLFVAVVGLLLYLTGVLTNDSAVKIIFIAVLVLSVIYAVSATFCKIFGIGKRGKKRKPRSVIVKDESVQPERVENYQREMPVIIEKEEQPKYFKVKQNPNLIMAEYQDRYELYEIDGQNLKKIRTDYK